MKATIETAAGHMSLSQRRSIPRSTTPQVGMTDSKTTLMTQLLEYARRRKIETQVVFLALEF